MLIVNGKETPNVCESAKLQDYYNKACVFEGARVCINRCKCMCVGASACENWADDYATRCTPHFRQPEEARGFAI